jgi:hypothetical protein
MGPYPRRGIKTAQEVAGETSKDLSTLGCGFAVNGVFVVRYGRAAEEHSEEAGSDTCQCAVARFQVNDWETREGPDTPDQDKPGHPTERDGGRQYDHTYRSAWLRFATKYTDTLMKSGVTALGLRARPIPGALEEIYPP